MKILTGMVSHETNVFSNIPTDLSKFEERKLLRGDEGLDFYTGTRSPIGGLVAAAETYSFDLVPTVFASAFPSGKVTDETFDTLLGEILTGIRKNRDLDGVLLHLHGAGVTESSDDLEGEIIRAVREEVDEAVPIVSCEKLLLTLLKYFFIHLSSLFFGYIFSFTQKLTHLNYFAFHS